MPEPAALNQTIVDIARAGGARPRDLADMAATAGEISIAVKYAGMALGDGWEWEVLDAAATAVTRLRRAAERLTALIAELEAAAARGAGR